MKILHTADLHLGKLYKGNKFEKAKQRREELWQSLENLIKYANENKIEIILISGDLYEKEYFTLSDYNRLADIFLKANSQIYIIAGNHDYIDKNSLISKINFSDNVNIFYKKEFFEHDGVRIYGLSWDRQFDYSTDFNFDLDNNYKNILMVHGSVGFESHFPINSEVLNKLDFDYIALGHFHGFKKVGNKAYYSGSLEPLRFKDEGEHGFIIYDLNTESVKFIKSAKRLYKIVEVNFTGKSISDIKTEINSILSDAKDDFVRLVLVGENDDAQYIIDSLDTDVYYFEAFNFTKPTLDVDKLISDDKSGIIENLTNLLGGDDEALRYGLEALMETKHENKRA